jgi:tetratricopeptide (TPR) repeat protein
MKLLFSIGFACFFVINTIAQTWQSAYQQAEEAYKLKDFLTFHSKMKEANRLHPFHQGVWYRLGIAAALNHKPEEAFAALRKAILINADYKLEGVDDLQSLKGDPRWASLIELQKKWKQSVTHSNEAFRLTDRQLHAEGIDFDPSDKSFYLGSIHKRKIVKVKSNGEVDDFCISGWEGMCSVFGLEIDQKNRVLWVCSSPIQEMENYDSLSRSVVFKIDLISKRLIQKYELPERYSTAIFGDLILDSLGNPFISDSKNNIIWTIDVHSSKLNAFYTSADFWNIQGLAFSQSQSELFIADYVKGIFKLPLKDKVLTKVITNLEVSLKGIDGLYFYRGSLIAVQNGVNPLRVMRFTLNALESEIVEFKIIESANSSFNEPTLGTFIGNQFYYIANSQWSGYDSYKIKSPELLQEIIVLKCIID